MSYLYRVHFTLYSTIMAVITRCKYSIITVLMCANEVARLEVCRLFQLFSDQVIKNVNKL